MLPATGPVKKLLVMMRGISLHYGFSAVNLFQLFAVKSKNHANVEETADKSSKH